MKYFNNLLKLRKLLGKSMEEMGQILDIPQTTYSNYEHGTREIPNKCISKLIQFGVDSSWLIGDSIAKDRCQAFGNHMRLNLWSSSNVAEKMNVPASFIDAIVNSEISPSFEFADRFYTTFKLPNPENIVNEIMQIRCDTLPYELEKFRLELARLQGNLDSERRQNEILSEKLDELIRENERLKKGG